MARDAFNAAEKKAPAGDSNKSARNVRIKAKAEMEMALGNLNDAKEATEAAKKKKDKAMKNQSTAEKVNKAKVAYELMKSKREEAEVKDLAEVEKQLNELEGKYLNRLEGLVRDEMQVRRQSPCSCIPLPWSVYPAVNCHSPVRSTRSKPSHPI